MLTADEAHYISGAGAHFVAKYSLCSCRLCNRFTLCGCDWCLVAQNVGCMFAEHRIHEIVRVIELLRVLRTCNNNTPCAKGRDRNFLTIADSIAATAAFTGSRTDTDAGRRDLGTILVPEELRIHSLLDSGFVGTPETIFLYENLVEAITANRLADRII